MNNTALLDFPNVAGMNGSNCDSENSHFRGFVTLRIMHAQFYSCSFFSDVMPMGKLLFGPVCVTLQ